MTKLFTGNGDNGTTGLLGGERVSKTDIRLEAIGTVDELSAFIGNARSLVQERDIRVLLEEIQRDLYQIMTEIAALAGTTERFQTLAANRVSFLEEKLQMLGESTVMPQEFILPGETHAGAAFSICRTVTRRAERRLVVLVDHQILKNLQVLRYINRLSSLFFLLEVKYSKIGRQGKLNYARKNL